MEDSQQIGMDNLEDARQLLEQARGNLQSLTAQVDGNGFNPEAVATKLNDALTHAQSAVDLAGKCLELDVVQRETEQRYSAIFDKSPFAFSLSSMPSGKLVSVNDAFLTLFEFTRQEVIGKTSPELDITDPESRRQVAALYQKNGFVREFECTRSAKSGKLLYLSLSLDPVTISGQQYVLTAVRDITDKKLADNARAESLRIAENERKRLLAVMEALPVGMAILDEKGGTLQSNRAFAEVWGNPLPPTVNVNDYASYKAWWVDNDELVEPEDWASAQAVRQGKIVTGQVMKIQKFDGSFAYVHNSAAPILDQQGKVTGCAVAIQDISQVKFREAEINQLNRTLKALSSSNQAMLRAESEQDFLDEVCRIIIEDCGFAMTWIGYAENDRQKSVRPVASAGFEEGYLEQLNISWANTPRGRGPTGLAIRTGKTSRCNNMLTDPKFAPWRKAAISRGYASSIVLPLISNGKAFGALNIYSRQPYGFSDEQEKLLEELAGDLAYGITTLRLKADQALAEQALRLSEERYRTIVETSSEGIAVGTPQGTFIYLNKQMADMLGYPVEEILGKTALDFTFPAETTNVVEARAVLDKGDALHGEMKFRRKDGSVLWSSYNASPMLNDKGEHIANLAMHTDITERKLFTERQAYLASFPEMNPRPIIEIDLEGNLIYVNPSALRMFPGITEKKLSHEYLSGWDSLIQALQQEPSGIINRDVSVGDRSYEQSFNLLRSRGLVRIYGMDITERKLATQALLEAREGLEQRVLIRTNELNIANEQLRAEAVERETAQVNLESSLQELQVLEEELRSNNIQLTKAQEIMNSERQRYQDLFEFAPDAYLVTDSFGKILEANQFAYQLLDVAHHQLIGKPLVLYFDKADHAAFNHLIHTLSHEGIIQYREFKLKSQSSSEVTAAITVVAAIDPGGESVLRWTLRDITESKLAEQIIRQNSLRNEVLSELSASLAEASHDEKTILEIVTRTCAKFIGDSCVINLASEDGQWLDPVAWHHNQPEVLRLMDSIFASSHHPSSKGLSGRVFTSSQPLLISQFDLITVSDIPDEINQYIAQIGIGSVLVVPLQIGQETLGTISMIRGNNTQPYTRDDEAMLEMIAYRTSQTIHNARLYAELQTALRNELETHDQLVQSEKFAAVGRLLASITHEINNPLQTIKNCLYLSQVDTQPGTPVYDALTMAVTETNRLSNLVAQLREIYRPPTTGIDRPVNIPALLSEVQSLIAGYLQEKHVAWQFNPDHAHLYDHLVIKGVPDQLKQVFLNLALNSIDAMDPGGGEIAIDLKLSGEKDQAGICFRDTGQGLTKEVKDKLFEPFITTKEKGLGLGLVICFDIVQKHNGSIEVESRPGEGAEFTIWLPVSEDEA